MRDQVSVKPGCIPAAKLSIGPVTKRLSPGEYTIRVFLRYGDHGQITRTKTIEVVQGQFNFPRADEIGAFDVEPITIEIEAKPGQRKSQVLQVTSEIQEPTVILLGGRDVAGLSLLTFRWVELRPGGASFLVGVGIDWCSPLQCLRMLQMLVTMAH